MTPKINSFAFVFWTTTPCAGNERFSQIFRIRTVCVVLSLRTVLHALMIPPPSRVQRTTKSSKNTVRTGLFVGHAVRYPIRCLNPGPNPKKITLRTEVFFEQGLRWTRGVHSAAHPLCMCTLCSHCTLHVHCSLSTWHQPRCKPWVHCAPCTALALGKRHHAPSAQYIAHSAHRVPCALRCARTLQPQHFMGRRNGGHTVTHRYTGPCKEHRGGPRPVLD